MNTAATDRTSPTRLLKPEVLAGLSNLELVARAVVEGFLIGLHRSPIFGFSQEFAEYRPYVEGDDPRFIDWNVFSRTERTYIKRFLGETNSHLMILLDSSASMGFASGRVSKLQYAKFLAASLAFLASKQHDAVGCMIFDEDIRDYRPPSTRSGKLHGVLHSIDAASPARGTDLGKPFQHFREYISKRGMAVVISDFYCDADAMIEGVRPLVFNGQDIIFFQIMDPEEMTPGYADAVLLEDIETGKAVEVSRHFIRELYPARVTDHIRSLKEAANSIGADYVLLNTRDRLDQALRNYLSFRLKRK